MSYRGCITSIAASCCPELDSGSFQHLLVPLNTLYDPEIILNQVQDRKTANNTCDTASDCTRPENPKGRRRLLNRFLKKKNVNHTRK